MTASKLQKSYRPLFWFRNILQRSWTIFLSFFFFYTIDLNFLLDKNFWALNKIFMNYRTYYYPIIQYPQRNLFYFASLSRWRASFMRNEQEKKLTSFSLLSRSNSSPKLRRRRIYRPLFLMSERKIMIFDDFYSTCFEKIWRKELFNDF